MTSSSADATVQPAESLSPSSESFVAQILRRPKSSLDLHSIGNSRPWSSNSTTDANRQNLQVLSPGFEKSKNDEIMCDTRGSEERNNEHENIAVDNFHQPAGNESADSFGHQTTGKAFSVHLKKTSRKENLKLEEDDPDFIKIMPKKLLTGIEIGRQEESPRFNDVIFTRQFTVMDRRNNESSLFWGFFTLFWVGTFFMVVKTGARNWHLYGSVFAGNEILTVSIQGDLLVLALTDGVLCASTAFCLLLQRLILAGYLSWERQGWIIQTVSSRNDVTSKTHWWHIYR